MKKKLLALSIVLTFNVGTFAYAKDNETLENTVIETISAEDIGVEVVKNENVVIEVEDKVDDVSTEKEEKETEVKDEIVLEEETESPMPPEGMVEGYEDGIYFEPNCFDCELCEECYKCEDNGHIYAHCVSLDGRCYIYEEWCTICGHGTSKVISNEEFELLGVETDVEF